MVTKVKFTKADRESVEKYIKGQLESRKNSDMRKKHEKIWKAIDKQIAMEPEGAKKEDWQSNIQLGDLADALEDQAESALNLIFPNDNWYRPHIDTMDMDINEGNKKADNDEQKKQDLTLRSLMSQQFKDFGFQDRVKASIKEALSHGGFVAVVDWEDMSKFHKGTDVETLGAPTWRPYSMWNCYPDPSTSIVGTELFYKGSMIIETTMKKSDALKQKDWINKDKIRDCKKKNNEDIQIIIYYGDIFIDRSRSNIYIPNKKVTLAEGHFVHQETNKTPYVPVIYTGYEKDDIRDPYFTSPLIKRSPMMSVATESGNLMMDALVLGTFPPLEYDSHSPAYARDGGPKFEPKAQIPTSGGRGVKPINVVEPSYAANALQMAQTHVQQGIASSNPRQDVASSTEQSAFEVDKKDQSSEKRTVAFVKTIERQGLMPYLYMHHELNTQRLQNYPFYNSEINSNDFNRWDKKDLPEKAVIFEIVGSKEVLGDRQRTAKFIAALQYVASNEEMSGRQDWDEISEEIWQQTGLKQPERFLLANQDENFELNQLKEQFAQFQQQAQQEIEKLEIEKIKAELKAQKTEVTNTSLKHEINFQEERQQAESAINSKLNQLNDESDKVERNKNAISAGVTQVRSIAQVINAEIKCLKAADDSEAQKTNQQQSVANINALSDEIGEVLTTLDGLMQKDEAREQEKTVIADFLKTQPGFESLDLNS